SSSCFFVLPPPRSTLCPYSTLFRSARVAPPAGDPRSLGGCLGRQVGPAPAALAAAAPLALFDHEPVAAGAHPAPEPRRVAEHERSEEHTSELQSPYDLVCRLLLEKK